MTQAKDSSDAYKRIYAISGSLRAASVHSALIQAFAANAPSGVEVEICELLGNLPIFNPDLEASATPEIVREFANAVGRADALIIASPEYAHGIVGGLKNAIDWLVSRPELVDKPFLLAHGYQHDRGKYALEALREVLQTASMVEMPIGDFSLPLVGKTPQELAQILNSTDVRKSISANLSDIYAFLSANEAAGMRRQ